MQLTFQNTQSFQTRRIKPFLLTSTKVCACVLVLCTCVSTEPVKHCKRQEGERGLGPRGGLGN